MYGIILAGGSGSRLWPLSRELYPKQLHHLNSDKSLLQSTFERLKGCTSEIINMTNTKHSSNVKIQLEELGEKSDIGNDDTAAFDRLNEEIDEAVAVAGRSKH